MVRDCLLLLSAAFVAQGVGAAVPATPSGSVFLHPKVLAVPGEAPLTVEAGDLFVPENRSHPDSRAISIAFYHFRTTAKEPATPIFVLAGGPGASALDEFAEDAEIRAMVQYFRKTSDVVLFDQRGAGHSRPRLDCPEYVRWTDNEVSSRSGFERQIREGARACRARWQRHHIDLNAYDTVQNAADTEALREALGYKRMTLVANSYGTHLSMALIRLHPASIERAVLYGLEGPDHTYDVPSEVLGSLEQIAKAAESSPQLHGRIPPGGLIAALKTVEERLERAPVSVELQRDGKSRTVRLGPFDIQRIARHGVHDLTRLAWPALVIEMFNGDFRRAAEVVLEDREWPMESAMFFMMDCASGISRERLARIRDPAESRATEILGQINLAYFATCDAWGTPDLGEAFRAPVVSQLPVLFIQGSWDVSTPFGNAVELVRGFRNGKLIKVEGGTHFALTDLLRSWPPILPLLDAFLRGRPFEAPAVVQLPEPVFVLPNAPR